MNSFPTTHSPFVDAPILRQPVFEPRTKGERGDGTPFLGRDVTFVPDFFIFTLRTPLAFTATVETFYDANECTPFWFKWIDNLWYQVVFWEKPVPTFVDPDCWDTDFQLRQYSNPGVAVNPDLESGT